MTNFDSHLQSLSNHLSSFKMTLCNNGQWPKVAKALQSHNQKNSRKLIELLAVNSGMTDIELDELINIATIKPDLSFTVQDIFTELAPGIGYYDFLNDEIYFKIHDSLKNKVLLKRPLATYLNQKYEFKVLNGLWYQYDNGVYKKVDEPIPYNLTANMIEQLSASMADDRTIRDVMKQWNYMAAQNAEASNLINLQNGLMDINGTELIPHHPSRVSFNQLPFEYNPDAEPPAQFFKFLKFALDDKKDFIDWIQKFMGYCLIPTIEHEVAAWFFGRGGTGKSTLAKIISDLVGAANVTTLRLDQLSNRFETTLILDKLLVWIDEITIDYFTTADENRLKGMMTGGAIPIEFKNKTAFTYLPKAKWIFTANSLPSVNDTTEGFWRRNVLIPFRNIPSKPDSQLIFNIRKHELPGIFNWALEGLHKLNKEGFKEPAESLELKQVWMDDSEPLRHFISERLEITGNPDDKSQVDDIFRKYRFWAEDQRLRVMPANHLTRKLVQMLETSGVARKKSNNVRYLTGLKLINN